LYGYTAQRTLEIAQNLYERRKLLSYPRTDSRHLSQSIAETLPAIVRAIANPYRELLAAGTGERPLGPRFVDDARVSDHHAILPTETSAPHDLSTDEQRIYDLVCRRLLSAWHGDHVFAVTTVVTEITWNEHQDRYTSSGTSVEAEGWKCLDVKLSSRTATPREPNLPGGLVRGMPRAVLGAKSVAKQTKPPPRFTDASLLTAMETAGRALDEKEISDAMRERGLGTPATRASILETLLKREYVVREGKSLQATAKGIALVAMVHPHVKSPAMTGEWEAKLARIERGEVELAAFMEEIERYVREVVGNASAPPPPASPNSAPRNSTIHTREAKPRPTDLRQLLNESFGFQEFKPYQEDVCVAAAAGHDVMIVMPTGAGKSLCYQLPGIARGGTTLVVSPLIALMEDQVAALVRRGFAAERIHSGRDRTHSRAVCKAYLDGALDFLFIAPERLKVTGFPEMLARRKPTLIAIDEAHCISQWGHDFRPDYRMLGDRLPLLRPAPVIALTATATPTVQDDIANELRLIEPRRFIHGFRRTNIGIEVVERNPSERVDVVRELLANPARRPAIVYAPTRKATEEIAHDLSRRFRTQAYHAGLTADVRDAVQNAFLYGKTEVIVATTAFGMGIDKPNVRTVVHAGLPATVEGYYQEIGRAGRDGEPSRAVLLHAFIDTKTHEFFLERDYPKSDVLAKIHAVLSDRPMSTDDLSRRAKVPAEVFEKALEKLWIHGGALIDADGSVRLGTGEWRRPHERQIAHKRDQLARIRRYAETPTCRMLQLVRHFGDQNDSGQPCGTCDVCASQSCVAQTFRSPTPIEQDVALRVVEALHVRDGRAVGQLHRELFGEALGRDVLARVLVALVRASFVQISDDAFDKDGETITFQRAHLISRETLDPARLSLTVEPMRATKSQHGKRPRKPRPPRRRSRPEEHVRTAAHDPLERALREWRKQEAKKRRVPAFRILTDRTLLGIVAAKPRGESELLEVSGIGPSLFGKYGKTLLDLVAAKDG
jgi:DNA topoisomerase III